jgi:hypothetical protein
VKTPTPDDRVLASKPEGMDPDVWLIICQETTRMDMEPTNEKNKPIYAWNPWGLVR